MKYFSSIENFMTKARIQLLGLILAVLLAACAAIGVIASFIELFDGAPVALLWMFASVAIPLSAWLMVWQLALSDTGDAKTADELHRKVERIAKSVDAIKKSVKAIDTGSVTASLEALTAATAKKTPARRASTARRSTSGRTARTSPADQSATSSDSES